MDSWHVIRAKNMETPSAVCSAGVEVCLTEEVLLLPHPWKQTLVSHGPCRAGTCLFVNRLLEMVLLFQVIINVTLLENGFFFFLLGMSGQHWGASYIWCPEPLRVAECGTISDPHSTPIPKDILVHFFLF